MKWNSILLHTANIIASRLKLGKIRRHELQCKTRVAVDWAGGRFNYTDRTSSLSGANTFDIILLAVPVALDALFSMPFHSTMPLTDSCFVDLYALLIILAVWRVEVFYISSYILNKNTYLIIITYKISRMEEHLWLLYETSNETARSFMTKTG